jgi:acetyl esterase/lipase
MPVHADPQGIPLWPHGAPGPKATSEAERDLTTAKDGKPAGKSVIRLGNVTEPTLTLYKPKGRNTGTTIVVFPGGGYHILAWDLEGTEVCSWLNSIGVTAVLVKYRVPQPEKIDRYQEPLEDGQRAIGMVRSHASEWHIDPNRVGVIGFSAGGHLAALLGRKQEQRAYAAVDESDKASSLPNFSLLVYPAYLSVDDKGTEVAPEVAVNAQTPKTFIVQAEDDHHFIEGTLLYYRALERAKIPAEMHLFPEGGHGYGLRPSSARVTGWPKLAEDWLRSLGLLNTASAAR